MRSLFVTAALLAIATAERKVVSVGANNSLTFDPPSLTAQLGDTVAFQFTSKNHTVTQSTFTNPCTRSPTGIDSGYLPVPPNSTVFPEWSITLNSTDPLWFFCEQSPPGGPSHCQKGMVFALNPTAEKTFDTYKATAMGSPNTTTGTIAPSASGSIGTNPSQGASGGAQGDGALSITGHHGAGILLGAVGLAAGFLL